MPDACCPPATASSFPNIYLFIQTYNHPMRIITGKYKGRHFEVPRTFKARPTTDFAKENLFNVLRAYLDFEETSALDLSEALVPFPWNCSPVVAEC